MGDVVVTPGRIVTYWCMTHERTGQATGNVIAPAVVTGVWPKSPGGGQPQVNLLILFDHEQGIDYRQAVEYGEDGGQWSWPQPAPWLDEVEPAAQDQPEGATADTVAQGA